MHINDNVLSEQHHWDQSSGGLSSGNSDCLNSFLPLITYSNSIAFRGAQNKLFHLTFVMSGNNVATLLPPHVCRENVDHKCLNISVR